MIHPTHALGPPVPHRDPARQQRTCTNPGCGATEITGRGCVNQDTRLLRPCGEREPDSARCGFIGPDGRWYDVVQANTGVAVREYDALGSGSRVRAKRGVGGQVHE